MNNEIISTLTEQTKNVVAPVQDLNRLVVDNAEKLVALQIASIQSHYALGFSNLKALLEVHDAEALQAYIGTQTEFAKSVSERLAGDAKAAAELGSDFTEEVKKLGAESVKAVTEKAA
ncbi:MAG: phasin family protein [Gammaproteobacteria bacterium]|nr:phasin family protein [Gammaproteobacteria bacterium]